MYYLARGSGSNTGTVNRISYVVTAPRLDLTVNGGDGPVVLTQGTSAPVLVSFDPGPAGPIDANVYMGVASPQGVFWMTPQRTFVPTITAAYSGTVGSFQSMTFVNLTNNGGAVSGLYWWFAIMVPEGSSNTTYSDIVLTVIP